MSVPPSFTKPSFRLSRSLLFWFGLFGLIFIVWSWVNSMHRTAGLGRWVKILEVHPPKTPHPPWEAGFKEVYGHSGGYLMAVLPIPSREVPLRIEVQSHDIYESPYGPPDARWFPMPMILKKEPWPFPSGASYTHTDFLVPHWILLATYLPIWTGAVAWRRRRANQAAPGASHLQ